ncbi:MAG: L-threonylcarbamoyladenylate synthase [Patescibacteria group bacterium]
MIDVNKVLDILNKGGIVVFPTDTAYGIGCRIDNEPAIKKLFQIRKRPVTQAAPVMVSSIQMAQRYLQPIISEVKQLMRKYWPGALTIIYPCIEQKIPSFVRGGSAALGVRIPANHSLLSIIEQLDCPILGPSANFHADFTPYKFNEINKDLLKLVDYAINDDSEIKGGISTVLDCTVKPFKIIRQGNIKI